MIYVDRGTIKTEEEIMLTPDDNVIIIEAFDEIERRRVHELMTENWSLLSLVRRRTPEGEHYTEYILQAPPEFEPETGTGVAPGRGTTPPVAGR